MASLSRIKVAAGLGLPFKCWVDRMTCKRGDTARMTLGEQVDSGRLVCPVARRPLRMREGGEWLDSVEGSAAYRVLSGGRPILLRDVDIAAVYVQESSLMSRDYARPKAGFLLRLVDRLRRDHRTRAARRAMDQVMGMLPPGGLGISPGGGPGRAHPALVNVNIGAFENVDIVADAHLLPYADDCVDVVHSEAVFEHLAEPSVAAKELFRVLRRGGYGFICTPFLQQYHGYPHHYQNFTLQGHRRIFESCGFEVIEQGHAVGPISALTTLVSAALRNFLPRPLNQVAWGAWAGVALIFRPFDRLLEHHPEAHTLASSTYLVVRKPTGVGNVGG